MVGYRTAAGCSGRATEAKRQNPLYRRHPTPVTLDSDLSTALAAFNTDKHMPVTLDGAVVETPTGAVLSATITDWNPVNGSPVVAD